MQAPLSLSFILTHMITRQCQSCEHPQACLLYTECLRHGQVLLDGRDGCRLEFTWTADALRELYNRTNVSDTDLACGRDDVFCLHMDQLEETQTFCTSQIISGVDGTLSSKVAAAAVGEHCSYLPTRGVGGGEP
jgi:hypothetical protein